MRRRKLLIGIGAMTAGGSAAFGTEAFTSVEAERSVDVAVAGDQSAYLALSAADSDNAATYVTQTGNGNVIQVDLAGAGDGSGVNDNAITKLDDLFTILNQGSQPVSVYVEDSSDAVTFRSDGSPIEGASNSVELAVGEEMVVSLTVDTTGDAAVGDTLTDSATLWATADDPAPGGTAPVASFNEVVKPDEYEDSSAFDDDPKYFETISGALDAASEGDNVGLDASAGPYTVSQSTLGVGTTDLTLAGKDGTPTIRNEGLSANSDGAVFEVTASGVTVQNLEIVTASSVTSNNTSPREISLESGADGATVANNVIRRPDGNGGIYRGDGTPTIAARGPSNVEITGNSLEGGPIGFNGAGGSVIDNVVDTVLAEGIFAFGGVGDKDFTVRGNRIENHNGEGSGKREIKLTEQPTTLNGQSDLDSQFKALIEANTVNTVRLAGGDGVTVDKSGSGSNLQTTVSAGISDAGQNGFVLIDGGTYEESVTPVDGITLQGVDGATLEGPGTSDGISLTANDVTLRGLTATNWNNGLDVSNAASPTGLLVENCSFDGNSFGWYASNDANQAAEVSSTFDDVTVRDTTFNDNPEKGLYLEKLSNATFDNIEVRRSGDKDPYFAPAGIDINLKFGDYSDITIRNSTFVDSGPKVSGMAGPNLHGALQLKARGTGGDGGYSSPDSDTDAPAPATLTNVLVEDNEFTFSASLQASTETVAIRAGEGNNVDPDITQPTPGEELTISGNRFENVDDEVRDLTQ